MEQVISQISKTKTTTLRHLAEDALLLFSARIDPTVTSDVHRILRLQGTLHNETGLMKKKCVDLDTFDPTKDPVVIGDEPVTQKRIPLSHSLGYQNHRKVCPVASLYRPWPNLDI